MWQLYKRDEGLFPTFLLIYMNGMQKLVVVLWFVTDSTNVVIVYEKLDSEKFFEKYNSISDIYGTSWEFVEKNKAKLALRDLKRNDIECKLNINIIVKLPYKKDEYSKFEIQKQSIYFINKI